jgi:Restriction endonuclease
MPPRAKSICRAQGCNALIDAPGYCETHSHLKTSSWGSSAQRGSRHARGYGTAWDKLRAQVLRRDCGMCQCDECRTSGRVRPATEVDHHIPKAEGGTDDLSNLRAINKDCHKVKTQQDRIRVGRE